jgi:thioredoxin reductase (NADPH)
VTGKDCSGHNGENPLQSSVHGVFAVGDVRSGSVKRVGSAIGEGAQVVSAIHRYLAEKDA